MWAKEKVNYQVFAFNNLVSSSITFFNGNNLEVSDLGVCRVENSVLNMLSCSYLLSIHVVIELYIGVESAEEMCGLKIKIENQQYTVIFKP